MTALDVSDNKIGVDGAEYISRAISRFVIIVCNLTLIFR
jgi:hypothetical protein